ncbi:MAG: hypothetical protein U0841_03900 [Chloroflexia bacterium]
MARIQRPHGERRWRAGAARELIVGAKFLVAGGWSAALLPLSYAVALGLGA